MFKLLSSPANTFKFKLIQYLEALLSSFTIPAHGKAVVHMGVEMEQLTLSVYEH
jgi:hypothetical protein